MKIWEALWMRKKKILKGESMQQSQKHASV